MESGCIAASDTTETKGTWVARKFTEKKNHVAGVTDTEGNTVSYEWDETTDLLKSLTDGRGNKISYRYDAAQRLSAVSQKVTIGNAQKTVTNAYTYKMTDLRPSAIMDLPTDLPMMHLEICCELLLIKRNGCRIFS